MLAIVADVPDAGREATPSAADAAVALARLEAMSADVRGAVILGPEGSALAASGDEDAWGEVGREMLAAADAAAGEPVTHAHVGTEDGEVFAVRQGPIAIVGTAERFALTSLLFSDARAVLRDLMRVAVGNRAPAAAASGGR
jgi:hypothetical protein